MTDVDSLPERLQDDVRRLYAECGYPSPEAFVEAAVNQHIRRTLKRYPHLDTDYKYRTRPRRQSSGWTVEHDGERCFMCGEQEGELRERVIELGGALRIVWCCGCWSPKKGPHPAEERMLTALGRT